MSSKQILIPSALFLFFCVLYIHNLSRGIYGGDVGDVVTAAYVFGVAHAPGYPLFTFLGYLLSHLFSFETVVFRVGLISAVTAALGIVFFYLTLVRLTKNTVLSILTALILGFQYLYWFYAEIAEVFALNAFFACILFYLATQLYLTQKKRYIFLLSFFSALALTNHQTILLIFPSLALLSFSALKKNFSKDWKLVLYAFFVFVLGFSVYIYIPIPSSTHPPINWDNVHDVNSFLHLLLRKDYGTFSAGPFMQPTFIQRTIILQSYLLSLLHQLTLPVVGIGVLGFFYLTKVKRVISLSLLLAFALSGPVFVIYAGFPLFSSFNIGVYERFFLLSSIIFLFYFPFGIAFLLACIKPYFRKESLIAIQLVFFLVPSLLFFYNYKKTNLSQVYIGDNLAKDILRPLPQNAVIFLDGDTILFNAQYVRYATSFRKDLVILNINGLGADPYFVSKQNEFMQKNPHEKDKVKITIGVIKLMIQQRPIFSTQQIKIGDTYRWIPYGLTQKLIKSKDTPSQKDFIAQANNIWNAMHIPSRSNTDIVYGSLTISEIPGMYANGLLNTGYFMFSEYKDTTSAESYFKKAESVDRSSAKVYSMLGVYDYTVKKDCKKAKKELETAISLSPFEKMPYFMLYSLAGTCYKDDKLKKDVISQYEITLQSNFLKDVKNNLKK